MKKVFALVLAMVLAMGAFSVSVAAEEAADKIDSVEIVILLDTSGSMNNADPERVFEDGTATRVAIEAAQQFVFNYPTETDMLIKVVPYNYGAYSGFDFVNVSTPDGLNEYMDQMQKILNDDETNNLVPEIQCWRYQTDIGRVMKIASNALADSTADKSAVILFTDGKIELSSDEEEKKSFDKAMESRSILESNNVPIYCVGLNYNNSVDEEFLKSLSDSEVTPGKTTVVTKASELSGVFQEIYTYLFEDSMLDAETDSIEVSPDVAEEKDIRIYGQAVREANISLMSSAPLYTLKVTTPSGVVVADVDYKNNKENIDTKYCVIDATASHVTANIKLLNPMDGNWTIAVTGQRSTVMVSKIYLFDLKLHSDITADKAYVGEEFKFSTTIYNAESDTHVTSEGLYSGESGATAIANVVNTLTNESAIYSGTLNSAGTGYDFSVPFSAPGTYRFDLAIKHAQFEIEGTATVEVVGPELGISVSEPDENGNSDTVSVYLVNPISGEKVTGVPTFIGGASGKLTIKSGETVVHEEEFAASDLAEGTYSYTYDAPGAGMYSAEAVLSDYDDTLTSAAVSLVFDPSTISLKGGLTKEISHSGMSPEATETLSLKDAFADSDGDTLTYTVSVADDKIASAKIDGDKLVIDIKAFGSTKVTLKVADGKGAELTHEINVVSESIVGLVVTIAIIAAVIIIALVIFIIIRNKKKVINFGFRVKISKEVDGNYTEAVYSVGRLASNRYAKGTMKLDVLLQGENGRSFSQLVSSNMEDAYVQEIIGACGNITVTGVPFKRAFVVTHKGKKKGTFTKNQIRVGLDEINSSVTFGSVNDFEDMNSYGY